MSDLKSFIGSLTTISEDNHSIIDSILSKVDSSTLGDWLEKVKVQDGGIHETYYAGLAEKLSFNDFLALYNALGYKFEPPIFLDKVCNASNPARQFCEYRRDYTCNSNTCSNP